VTEGNWKGKNGDTAARRRQHGDGNTVTRQQGSKAARQQGKKATPQQGKQAG